MIEHVVLLDANGAQVGSLAKDEVHTTQTPLHLAFSCYVFNDGGELLVTRRALTKATWPGVWTNSFCGHPAPGEPMEDALARRARDELGMTVTGLTLALAEFRYTATDASGLQENELCPVYLARAAGSVAPVPSEVAETGWVAADDVATAVRAAPWAFSPWLVLQLDQLGELEEWRRMCDGVTERDARRGGAADDRSETRGRGTA